MKEPLKIEKGIPLPPRMRYPFDQMAVGDSIVVPANEYKRARMSATNYAIRNDALFSSRQLEDGTARIWRVK
jgi:hypothetical protein